MTSNPELSQPDDRSRQQVRDLLDRNIYVEAGAGTGKTRALIDRLIELLVTREVEPENIAAITFTRGAAFEMRWRLRAELERRLADSGDHAKSDRINQVLDTLDGLAIQTIHAFALSMLREHPLEIGLTPVIEPLDDVQASVEFEAMWSEWISERVEDDEGLARALGIAQRFGIARPVDLLRELAEKLGEHQHSMSQADYSPAPPTPDIPTSRLADILHTARGIIDSADIPDDTMSVFFRTKVQPQIESTLLLAGDSTRIAAADLVEWEELKVTNKGAKSRWSKTPAGAEALDELRTMFADLWTEIADARAGLARETLSVLLGAAIEFASDYARHRLDVGRLTFHDHLVLAIKLLQTSAPARNKITARFQHILVDEFQDTDPDQIALLTLLASNKSGESGELRPGQLFLVGDPKQSIYRFRGADPVSSNLLAASVGDSGDTLQLSQNHRSRTGILDWVNTVFSAWMKEGEASGQAEYKKLLPGGEQSDSSRHGPVWWFGGERKVKAHDLKALEFEEMSAIALAVGQGQFQVRSAESETGWRASKFSDLAILVRTRAGVDTLEERLTEKNVPYTLDTWCPLFTSQDVRDLHACLAAIDDPSNEVAVLSALRSPAFSCPDTDLLLWKNRGGTFSYLETDHPSEPESVADAFDSLRTFHRHSRNLSTADLVEEFIRERKLREKTDLTRTGPDRSRRLDLVAELARALSDPESGEGISLRDFTRWLVRQSDDNAQMPERLSQGQVEDAVRIMTIHTSKGLEFPIVAVASVSRRTGGGGDSLKLIRTRSSANGARPVEVQVGSKGIGMTTVGWEDALARDDADGLLEEVRLLYVAATRAKDHLLLSLYRRANDKDALSRNIEQHIAGNEHLWQQWEYAGRDAPDGLSEKASGATGESAADRDAWISSREHVLARAKAPRYTTPTQLKHGAPGNEHGSDERGGDKRDSQSSLTKEPAPNLDDEPTRRGRAATDLGRAVHAVLQDIDLTDWTDATVAAMAEQAASEHRVAESSGEIAELAIVALGTPIMRRAATAAQRGEAWREVSVAAPLPGGEGELEGQIDLLFKEDDGTVTIVDHKTDRYLGNTIEQSAEPYLLQMGGYAWCVEQVTGQPVSRSVLLFSRRAAAGEPCEYEVPDLKSVAAAASSLASDQVGVPQSPV